MIRDLECWFTEARRTAEYFGCKVEIVDGGLALTCDGYAEPVTFTPPEAVL